MVACWKENAKPLTAFFDKHAAPQGSDVENDRSVPRTREDRTQKNTRRKRSTAKSLYPPSVTSTRNAVVTRCEDDIRAPEKHETAGHQALTPDEQQQSLFRLAASKPEMAVCVCREQPCRLLHLRSPSLRRSRGFQAGSHIGLAASPIGKCDVQKRHAGWRDPKPESARSREVLRTLGAQKRQAVSDYGEPDHFLFPWHGRDKKIDPTRPMTSWRSAWRSLRTAAGLSPRPLDDGRAQRRLTPARRSWSALKLGHYKRNSSHVSPSDDEETSQPCSTQGAR